MSKATHAELEAVEIFGVGTWKDRKFTEEHLDEMVENFEKIQKYLSVPMKLGHSDRQVIAQKDGQPALGWVSKLYRKGKKLLADFADVPKVMLDAIRAGRYRNVSAEIYPTFEATSAEKNLKSGVKGHVLSAVAFLGADIPEVKTLKDLASVLASEGEAALVFDDAPPGEALAMGMPDAQVSVAEMYCVYDAPNGLVVLFIVRQEGDEWVLYDSEGEKVLGRHKTKEDALAQERAIQAGKHMNSDSKTTAIHAKNSPEGNVDPKSGRGDMTDENKDQKATPSPEAEELKALREKLADAEGKIQLSETAATDLKSRVEMAERRQAEAEQKALRAEADAFVDKYRKPDCIKIFNDDQAGIIKALYCQKAGEILKMADKDGKEKDETIVQLLTRFLDAQPDQKVLLTEVSKHTVRKPNESFLEAVHGIIMRDKMDPVKDFDRAVKLAMTEKPHLYDYGAPETLDS
jgi:hypothetical protein